MDLSKKLKVLESYSNIKLLSLFENDRFLSSPVGLVSHPQKNSELYIVDQIGIIWKYSIKTKKLVKFLDISTWVVKLDQGSDERGLLSMAFHPKYGKKDSIHCETFYIFYSTSAQVKYTKENSDKDIIKSSSKSAYYNCVSAFTELNPDKTVNKKSELVVLGIEKKINYHNGGKIGFGPDGYLYITVGDGGPQKDTYHKSQNLSTWHGKILRIDVENVEKTKKFTIPKTNPFWDSKDSSIRKEIYAYGFRNPVSFQR